MMDLYRPPLRDIRFVLEHICDLGRLTEYPDFDHVDPGLTFSVLEEAGRFVSEVIAPTNRDGDVVGSFHNEDGSVTSAPGFKEAYRQYIKAGWGAVSGPVEYGGHGFPGSVATAIQEMVTSANVAFSLCPMLTGSAVLALGQHGTPEQRDVYLEKLVTGEWTGTMVLTEPEAGSDVGALRARAVPGEDDTWTISGTKIFITWGEHDMAENIVHLVLARAPGAPRGTRGISMFVVPKFLPGPDGSPGARNAVRCLSIEDKLGIHGSPTCVLEFEDATGWMVGDVHQGMRYMFTMMNDARLQIALEGLGLTVRSYQQALAHAIERRQGRAVGTAPEETSPIIEHPDVRRMLMTMRVHAGAMRALLYDTAAAIDRSRHDPDADERAAAASRAALLTPVGKAWSTDVGVEMTSLGIQIHGGMGYVEETGSAQHLRDARIAPIYEGTNGIQAIDLVRRKVPANGGRNVKDYLAEMDAMAHEVDSVELAAPLLAGVAALSEATDWILSNPAPNDVLAGATPYLRLFGTVAAGYYLIRLARAAEPTASDDEFAAGKIADALFYAGQVLPQAPGLVAAVTAGAAPLYALGASAL